MPHVSDTTGPWRYKMNKVALIGLSLFEETDVEVIECGGISEEVECVGRAGGASEGALRAWELGTMPHSRMKWYLKG